MERRTYPQHLDKKRKVISRSTKPRNGGYFEMAVYTWPNGKKTNGKPALASQTYHERIS